MPNEIVGVPPCPNCGAPLIPNVKCESCGYNPKATSCERCGTRFDGEKCDLCGWSDKAPICRNCGADLTDNHIMLKTLIDKWVWKTCAYCGTPIEQWLYTILGEIKPYEKPYESSYSGGVGGSLVGEIFGEIFGAVILIIIAGTLLPTIASFTTGFKPNANITSNQSINGTVVSLSRSIGGIANLLPVVFVAIIFLVVTVILLRHLGDIL